MAQPSTPDDNASQSAPFALTAAQIHYFDTFGYLKIPGLLKDDIETINRGFEHLFGNEDQPVWETQEALHGEERRVIIPGFIEQSPLLAPLQHDPRIVGIVRSLIGPAFKWSSSDGNLFYCESYWHSDMYATPLQHYHIKISIYLDELTGDSGAIRIIPGSHFHTQTFGRTLQRDFKDTSRIEEVFGVEGKDIPAVTIESSPGDVIIWNFRTIHASYNGGERRRLFSLNFGEEQPGNHDGDNPIVCGPYPYRTAPVAP